MRLLHVLSQRPSLTGSGVTLFALASEAATMGWEQSVLCAVPADDPSPVVASIDRAAIHTVRFDSTTGGGDGELPFPVPGMSDVMPYASTIWSTMSPAHLEAYRAVWADRLAEVIGAFGPDVIHAHHGWIVAGLIKDVAPGIPLVIHTHGTALRQRVLCPDLADEVATACRRADAWVTLHDEHRRAYSEAYGLEERRVHVVGAGYREDLFRPAPDEVDPLAITYAGKLSEAKGLGPLLDAVDLLRRRRPGVRLHVAGSGSGPEAEALEARMTAAGDHVTWHGRLDQSDLAALLRRSAVFALPSFYEGLPLVLVEAAACGNRLVATALPGVLDGLAPHLEDALEMVPLPPMASIDRPDPVALLDFTDRLARALDRALDGGPIQIDTTRFTWTRVAERVATVWSSLSNG